MISLPTDGGFFSSEAALAPPPPPTPSSHLRLNVCCRPASRSSCTTLLSLLITTCGGVRVHVTVSCHSSVKILWLILYLDISCVSSRSHFFVLKIIATWIKPRGLVWTCTCMSCKRSHKNSVFQIGCHFFRNVLLPAWYFFFIPRRPPKIAIICAMVNRSRGVINATFSFNPFPVLVKTEYSDVFLSRGSTGHLEYYHAISVA